MEESKPHCASPHNLLRDTPTWVHSCFVPFSQLSIIPLKGGAMIQPLPFSVSLLAGFLPSAGVSCIRKATVRAVSTHTAGCVFTSSQEVTSLVLSQGEHLLQDQICTAKSCPFLPLAGASTHVLTLS